MVKLPIRPSPPAIVDLTVAMPRRRPNAKYRSREHLTDGEIDKLMATARNNRWGQRDPTMILVAYRHGLRVSELVDLPRLCSPQNAARRSPQPALRGF